MQAASVDHQCSASWNMAKVLLCEGYRFEIITLLYKYFTQMALNAIVRGKKPTVWCLFLYPDVIVVQITFTPI